MGVSTALVDHLVAHPDQWRDAVDAVEMTPEERTEALLAEIADHGDLEPQDALRVGYRRQLLGIVARDVTSDDAVADLPDFIQIAARAVGQHRQGLGRAAALEVPIVLMNTGWSRAEEIATRHVHRPLREVLQEAVWDVLGDVPGTDSGSESGD